jgi:hypothetical protein
MTVSLSLTILAFDFDDFNQISFEMLNCLVVCEDEIVELERVFDLMTRQSHLSSSVFRFPSHHLIQE